jgi:predicted ribonuclease YlaK
LNSGASAYRRLPDGTEVATKTSKIAAHEIGWPCTLLEEIDSLKKQAKESGMVPRFCFFLFLVIRS